MLYLCQKKNYGNSNISPCKKKKNLLKNPLKETKIFDDIIIKKEKKRLKYVALDFSADFLIYFFPFISVNLREEEKNPKKKIQKKQKIKKEANTSRRTDGRMDGRNFYLFILSSFLLI